MLICHCHLTYPRANPELPIQTTSAGPTGPLGKLHLFASKIVSVDTAFCGISNITKTEATG